MQDSYFSWSIFAGWYFLFFTWILSGFCVTNSGDELNLVNDAHNITYPETVPWLHWVIHGSQDEQFSQGLFLLGKEEILIFVAE